MYRTRRWVLGSALLGIVAWTACGGRATSETAGDATGADSGSEAGSPDGGLATGCPTTAPANGTPCTPKGLVCSYTSDMKPCGKMTCGSSGAWEGGSFNSLGCPLPAGLTCPSRTSSELRGSAEPVDESCVVDADCTSVVFQTDCCGNTVAYGVNKSSVSAATVAATTCKNGFPGCGCPESPTVAQTGKPDGGASFNAPIDAYCAAGTCKTRYR